MTKKAKPPTLRQFQDRFPTEDSCLEHLMRTRFGERHDCEKCGNNAKFYRAKKRRSYACEHCGAQVYPTAGTPFHRTRTSLRDWFYVMFMFCATRNGVAAKEVERQIGVTYKTAWRMCHEIRKYMAAVDGDEPLGGFLRRVEVDETYMGGVDTEGDGKHFKRKAVILGMLEKNGDVMTRVIPNRRKSTLQGHIVKNVRPYTQLHTDEFRSYIGIDGTGHNYEHRTVNHRQEQWVAPDGTTTNAIEGFWSHLKRSVLGTHIYVSPKHLSKYLGEFEFRYNRRHAPHAMLDELFAAFAR